MDYLGADVYLTDSAPAHDILLTAGVILVEGLQLNDVAAGWYTLICLPIKVQGADGAPARAILVDTSTGLVS
jgi:arylformamidase